MQEDEDGREDTEGEAPSADEDSYTDPDTAPDEASVAGSQREVAYPAPYTHPYDLQGTLLFPSCNYEDTTEVTVTEVLRKVERLGEIAHHYKNEME